MKRAIASILACLATSAVYAETYNYSCKVCMFPSDSGGGGGDDGCEEEGKAYPLRVDENKSILEWRGKKYSLTVASVDESQTAAPNTVGKQKATERRLHSVPRRRDVALLRTKTALSELDVISKGDGSYHHENRWLGGCRPVQVVVGMMMAIGVLQDLRGHAQEPGRLPDWYAALHQPGRGGVA